MMLVLIPIITFIMIVSSFLVILTISPNRDNAREIKDEGVICKQCGHNLYDNESFCSKCGWKL